MRSEKFAIARGNLFAPPQLRVEALCAGTDETSSHDNARTSGNASTSVEVDSIALFSITIESVAHKHAGQPSKPLAE